MTETNPSELIQVFDRVLLYVYGIRYARDNPHKSDMETATLWASIGCDIVIESIVLYDRMRAMHERHLHIVDMNDRTHVPCTMKVFTENIEAAIRKQSGDEVDETEKAYSQWRARVKGWRRNPKLWREDHWGPPPLQRGCRVPKAVMAEFA